MANENRNATVWKWSVLLLAALNIALLLTVWLKPNDKHNSPPDGGGPGAFIIEQLHFTEAQIQTFDGLKHAHHDSVEAIQARSRKLREALFQNLQDSTANASEVERLTNEIAANQKKIELVTYYHFKEVRALCDEKQKPVFDSIIGEVLRILLSPQRQGPPPR